MPAPQPLAELLLGIARGSRCRETAGSCDDPSRDLRIDALRRQISCTTATSASRMVFCGVPSDPRAPRSSSSDLRIHADASGRGQLARGALVDRRRFDETAVAVDALSPTLRRVTSR
jgi:hypothetical protein